ncbi:MAG: protein-disulfide reductase DsbD family protein [Candidatus Melainabacteria bacterium]|nr:protein-disulfide reductase DsbD family protein [Candidatus Melainabacteria bacterium]
MRLFKYSKLAVGRAILAFALAIASSQCPTSQAQTSPNNSLQAPVQTSLSCPSKEIMAGKPFNLFVDFEMEPGWHIYHKNPGESGMPTKVQWILPTGFKVEEQKWPQPETFKESGIVTYGHSKKLRLGATVTPPGSLKTGHVVQIKVAASWLACKHSCVPGNKTMAIELKVGSK